jgi:D-methionine transport system substrate-binding protein
MFVEAIQPALRQKGYGLELVYYDDFIQPNIALANSNIDLNMFQHNTYLNDFKVQHDLDLAAIVEIPTASMGVFSRRFPSINALRAGLTVAIPNDNTNRARALRVLSSANLVTLNPSVDSARVTEADIISNPYRMSFTLIPAQNLVNSLASHDIAVINGNFALSGGLSLGEALYNEVLAENYINVIAVRTEDLGQAFVRDILEAAYSPEYVRIMVATEGNYAGFQRPRYFFEINK